MRFIHQVAGIEEFVRTAETLSFVGAAQSLGLTPSAVSKAIGLLEARLQVRLLHRTTRRVSLTDDGVVFYERSVAWLATFQAIQADFSANDVPLQGGIRIDMPVTYGRILFMPYLATFLARHPLVNVEVRMNDRHVDLVAEGVDLALRIGDLNDSDLVVKPLGRVVMGTYASAGYQEKHGTPQHPSELTSHRLIAFMQASGRPKKLRYRQQDQNLQVDTTRTVATFNNGEAMTDAVIAGIGIGQLPTFHARDAVATGQLTQVLSGWDAEGPNIQLVYPSRKHLSPRVRALIDFIACELSGHE